MPCPPGETRVQGGETQMAADWGKGLKGCGKDGVMCEGEGVR